MCFNPQGQAPVEPRRAQRPQSICFSSRSLRSLWFAFKPAEFLNRLNEIIFRLIFALQRRAMALRTAPGACLSIRRTLASGWVQSPRRWSQSASASWSTAAVSRKYRRFTFKFMRDHSPIILNPNSFDRMELWCRSLATRVPFLSSYGFAIISPLKAKGDRASAEGFLLSLPGLMPSLYAQ